MVKGPHVVKKEAYRKVKRMDRDEFDAFCTRLYENGYMDGRESVKGIDVTALKDAIKDTPGIGEKRLQDIMKSIEEKFGEKNG